MQKEILRVENLSKKFPVRKNILAKTRHWIAAASEINFQLFRLNEISKRKGQAQDLLLQVFSKDLFVVSYYTKFAYLGL